jgi:hypothetical protein
MMASTSGHAITVPEGESLELTLRGTYQNTVSGDIQVGSSLNFINTTVDLINSNGSSVSLYQGLTPGSGVGVSGTFSLSDGSANSGLKFSFADPDASVFVVGQTFSATVSQSGTGSSGAVGLGELDTVPGSFSYATSSDAEFGLFQLTLAVPPTEDISELAPIPLPAAAWMMLAALGSLLAFRRDNRA